jgi:protein-tyrosine phosphatase
MQIKKIRVLFVCLGNICRSPAAEGAFQHLIELNELEEFFHVDSCGTGNYHIGELPHETTLKVAESRGITLNHKCRQFITKDFERFDYIFVMDKNNYSNVVRLAENQEQIEKVIKFRKFDPHCKGEPPDVPDPYSNPISSFEYVQDIVERCSAALLRHLIEKYKLFVPGDEEEYQDT